MPISDEEVGRAATVYKDPVHLYTIGVDGGDESVTIWVEGWCCSLPPRK